MSQTGQFSYRRASSNACVVLGHAPHREAAEQGGRAVGVGAAPPAAPDAREQGIRGLEPE